MKCFRDLPQEGMEPGTSGQKNDRCMGLRDDWMAHVDIPAFVPNHHLITATIRRAEHIFFDFFIIIYIQLYIYVYYIKHSNTFYILGTLYIYTLCLHVRGMRASVRIQSIQAVKVDHDLHPDFSYNVVAPSY